MQIDVDQKRILADVPILHARSRSLGPRVTPDGQYLLWSGSEQPDYGRRTLPVFVSLFDIASGQQTTPFVADGTTEVVAFSLHPSAMRAYLQLSFGGPVTMAQPGSARTLPSPPCSMPFLAARSGDGARLSFACYGPFAAIVVDSLDGQVVATVPHGPTAHTLNDDGTEMFTVDWDFESRIEPTVYRRFDVATGALLAERIVSPDEFDGSLWLFNRQTGHLYAGNWGKISVLDAATLQQLDQIDAPSPEAMPFVALDPDRPHAYVVWWGQSGGRYLARITRVDTRTFATLESGDLALDSGIVGVALGPRPPSLIGLSAVVENRSVTLTWTTMASRSLATGLVVEAGSAPGERNLARLPVSSTVTSVTVPGVPRGTYYVRVRAVNGTGPGEPSNELIVVVP